MNSQLLNDNWLMSGALETGGRSEDIASFLKKREKTFSWSAFGKNRKHVYRTQL